ncbi:class I SAM-dependent methyltransferase [Solirubrobacter sp. CPCC 204708]|uniref:Class I SAM-dependent methyltransferase n=1 Tax=Solirubrobacter deserti TaxID=2282478 RepID=A0ABT4RWA8_9ACTN|nr:class I SAM-dependent methyltransferase [Solirubrobacter deserti]MBE2316397.1 class I SAM-dependent methyltransferase [Solirubrobacter deserti]MDA0142525.1 class I SAM-dependent methyltransferase [Solirubrobacter deserti]
MIEGWLTEGQAARLEAAAARSRPSGAVVEIGSFRGKSAVVLARAARSLIAIDPHAGSDRGPQEIGADAARGDADFEAFHANLESAGVADRVRHVRKFSSEAHADVTGPLSLLYVDGAHRFGPARSDLHDWGVRVAPGGVMLVHDSFSSIGVTLALLVECFWSPRWRYVGRTGSLAEFERVVDGPRDVGAWLRELPWFARNVVIKVLVVAGQRRWAERIGLDPAAPWPY